jgi:proteic killer suppression protein
MIKSYRNKGLKELFESGRTGKIDKRFQDRCLEILSVVNAAASIQQLNVAGFNLHQLKQFKPVRFSIWVSGAWRITFEFEKGDAYRVDFEQYH